MSGLVVIAAVALATLFGPAAGAGEPIVVSGGGTGTFAADVDADGDIDGSHFGLGATVRAGSLRGHFECQMAGNADFLGLKLMAVEGRVAGGWASSESGTALLSGNATVNLANGVIFRDVPYQVQLWAGGPGAGRLKLTVIGAFDGVAGDTLPGNGNYDLPTETVATGRITVR
jgi:hypothetical protein